MPTETTPATLDARPSRPQSLSGSDDRRVIAALEEYLRLYETGDAPEPSAFAADHPEIRETLETALAGLVFMQQAAVRVETSNAGISHRLDLELSALEPLGDYRIIGEIGRGGMGIVYEAEQMSLARRVALKILPFASVLDPRHLQRFKNEALAAAHLDHPNIVEVYAVGCERGVHFYAMRLVEGQTLAAVIEALKGSEPACPQAGNDAHVSRSHAPRANAPLAAPRHEAANDINPAQEGYARPDLDPHSALCTPYSVPADTPHSELRTANSYDNPHPNDITPAPDDSLRPSSLVLRPSSTDTSPIAALSTLRTERPRDFYRLVAELGIQAAEALDHAHQMGIVHRDIKPSNLMVECSRLAPRDGTPLPWAPAEGRSEECSHLAPRDGTPLPWAPAQGRSEECSHLAPRDGTPLPLRGEGGRGVHGSLTTPHLYITDFGLAHIESDAALTMTGDLLGTLRYMSPEQAEGRSAILDHRTDIYSLGITLYELLTLQPAFPPTDRQTLLRQIANDEPIAPRKLNNQIPADLETILLKSISKDPRDRYATAAELAADLARFATEKPIAAHPPTRLQQAVRWSRRHAGLVLAVSVVLLILAAASAISTVLIGQAYQDKAAESQRADSARQQAEARTAFAKEVVDEMYTKIARKWLANEPRMTPLQQEFLDKALAFYDEMAREQPTDLAARHDRAMAIYQTFEIQIALGHREDALERLEQAHSEMARVLAKEPDNAKYQNNFANICMTRGVLLNELGKVEDGRDSIEQAIDRWSELAKQFPKDPIYRGNIADALMNLGATHLGSPESERLFRQAIATYQSLIRDGVNVEERTCDLARANIDLATTLNTLTRLAEAQKTLESTIDVLEPLVGSAHPSQGARDLLCGAYHALGQNLAKQQRCPEALAPLEKSRTILASLAADFPETVRYRERLSRLNNVCETLRKQIGNVQKSSEDQHRDEKVLEDFGNLKVR